MHPTFERRGRSKQSTPIWFVHTKNYADVRRHLSAQATALADLSGFEPNPGKFLLLPGKGTKQAEVLFGVEAPDVLEKDVFLPGRLVDLLPQGTYRFANRPHDERLGVLAFGLGAYRFARYRKSGAEKVKLVLPDGIDGAEVSRTVESVWLARDLINTPSNDMGPAELESATRKLARLHRARCRSIVGGALLRQNLPLIHAVGKGSARAPRLVDLTWGNRKHPKVTLVGKGVCFDSGGLDIKPEGAMLLMKKDMGGAATALALAHMIMDGKLPVRLRVLIPAVENSVSGSAFRPLDVYPSRKDLTVEIGNTDAEGRLVLADALALADEEKPGLLIDFGTLTGAARVALGPDVPPFYTKDDRLARALAQAAQSENDPLWRMPLWTRYDSMLDSKIADVNNVAQGGFAGSIICALFLQRFVTKTPSWLHVDIYAWTPSAQPGRPEGGECQAARAVYALLKRRYTV